MQDLPHHYRVEARAEAQGDVALRSGGLADLASQPPAEFGGPGDRWSPETLLLAAVADCYALSFRVLAANSKVGFRELTCRAEGLVDRADGKIRFTQIALAVEVALAADANPERAQRLLERAKDVCIVSNSLSVPVRLDARIAGATG
jgi:peroxiredoxin-like protein